MRGLFRFWPDTPKEVQIHNNFLTEGEEAFLKMIFQAATGDVAVGGNFYIGLCGVNFANTDTLATLGGEPSAAGGYARIAAIRSAVGWPSVAKVGGVWRAKTGTLTFAASGANFSTSIRRAFLCNVASGSGGKLFSVSGALADPILVLDGASLPMIYEAYLR